MVLTCSNCGKLISVSSIPGGNPTAIADPESWSMSYRGCAECGATLCGTCTPLEILDCPKCHSKIERPARDPNEPYVYRKPRSHEIVMPGPGPTDFMDTPVPVEKFLAAVPKMIPQYQPNYKFMGLNIIYRMLGSPRAWQLGGELALLQLAPEVLQIVIDWAQGVLSGVDTDALGEPPRAGQKYFYSHEPRVTFADDYPAMDLCDAKLVERLFWICTMPIEFVESVARLREKMH